jgi:hypothetical protein
LGNAALAAALVVVVDMEVMMERGIKGRRN